MNGGSVCGEAFGRLRTSRTDSPPDPGREDHRLDLNEYQGGMCNLGVLKTAEGTLIRQPNYSSRSVFDRRCCLTIPVFGLLQLALQPQTNESFGE